MDKDKLVKDIATTDSNPNNGDYFQYLALKSEKLAAAVHLVTNFINDASPIKWKVRERALTILTATLLVKQGDVPYKLSAVGQLIPKVEQILSYFTVAMTDGAASEMNFNVLKAEYANLLHHLQSCNDKASIENQVALPQPKPFVLSNNFLNAENKSFTADPLPQQKLYRTQVSAYRTDESRRRQIIDFVTKNGWSAITSIAKAVPGFSSKTVQRELVSLVKEGLLRKKGDRRWSRYQLASR